MGGHLIFWELKMVFCKEEKLDLINLTGNLAALLNIIDNDEVANSLVLTTFS